MWFVILRSIWRRLFLTGLGLSIFYSCTSNVPKSIGKLREVTIITDYWQQVGPQVESILTRPVSTPQPEPEFLLRIGDFGRFSSYSRLRIVFIIGLSRDSIIKEIMMGRLDTLVSSGYMLFKFPNAWVTNQWVLVFVAEDTAKLVEGLSIYAERIRRTVTELVLEQMSRATYFGGKDEELTDSIKKRFGFSIDVPRGWLFQDKHNADNFIFIYTHFPDRSVFVFWSDTIRTIKPDSILNIRDWLTGRFYDGDSVDRSEVLVDTIDFMGGSALRIRGVWQNRREVLGGPFVSYAFIYQGRFFLLDGVVFNPGKKKLSNLFQVEAIIRTFVPG